MREIPITSRTHGACICLIDDEDYPLVSQYRWYVTKQGYVTTVIATEGRGRKGVKLHRLLTNAPAGVMVDHHNRNKLDNRRENLRLCVRAQNQANRARADHTDGVSWDKKGKAWRVTVGNGGTPGAYKGTFHDRNAALNCYNHHAVAQYGEFAVLNPCIPLSQSEWEALRLRKTYGSRYTYVHASLHHGKQGWSTEVVVKGQRKRWLGFHESEDAAMETRNAYIRANGLDLPLSVLRSE